MLEPVDTKSWLWNKDVSQPAFLRDLPYFNLSSDT